MSRFRAIAYLALALTLTLYSLAQSQPPATENRSDPTASRTRVKIERGIDTTQESVLTDALLGLETEYGLLSFRIDRIKSLEISHRGPKPMAFLTATDGSHFRGKPAFDEIHLQEGGPVPITELRRLTTIRTHEFSLMAVILGLITLAIMEIVLGIDNIIFLAILVGKLPQSEQPQARKFGLAAALGTRILLLFSLSWLLGLTRPVFTLPFAFLNQEAAEISWRDLILLSGGLFLIWKSVKEMHQKIEETREKKLSPHGASAVGGTEITATETAETEANAPGKKAPKKSAQFFQVIIQIAIIDIVFSLDSVITAVGMVDEVWVMIGAMVMAMMVMLFLARPISEFVDRHPTVKLLALSFLILIGVLLAIEALGQHVDKSYVYFAMGFAVIMELLNMAMHPKGVSEMMLGDQLPTTMPE